MNAKRRCFLDTNILVYVFDNDAPEKQDIATRMLDDHAVMPCFSTQVLQEFYVAVTRKLARPLPPEQAYEAIQQLRHFPVSVVTAERVMRAVRRSIDSRLSFWDALIVESALAEKADLLVTEDLQDGWQVGALRVWNPFSGSRLPD